MAARTSVVGRFNEGMTGLAILLLAAQHSSYAIAGIISARGAAGAFVAGPVLSLPARK